MPQQVIFLTTICRSTKYCFTACCIFLTVAAGQKTIPSSSCHLSSAGQPSCRGDQNPGVRRAQGSQDQPSALTRVTQAEHAQQDSVSLAYSQPPASCNLPTSGKRTHSLTPYITTVTFKYMNKLNI